MLPEVAEVDARRFWAKVQRGKVAECWLWQGATGSAGYGQFWVKPERMSAHRVAYYLGHAHWPKGVVRHQCDTPWCCSPRPLRDSMRADTVREMRRRGRASLGELHPQAKLSDADIRRMRERYARGLATQMQLAREYRVTQEGVGQVVRGERRRAAGGPLIQRGRGRKAAAS